jgi:uncharacterized protein YkwD
MTSLKNLFYLFIGALLFASCETELFTPSVEEMETEAKAAENNGKSAMPKLFQLVNDLRKKGCQCGSNYMPPVASLSWNADLDAAARRHADDMFTNDFFDHTGSDGSTIARRVTDTGYPWQAVGENIAWGYRDIESVFLGWKNSPGHCRNMMNAGFRDMGSARIGDYWVQAFGRARQVN